MRVFQKSASVMLFCLFSSNVSAELVSIKDNDLSAHNAQSGIIIDADLQLNRTQKTESGKLVVDKGITCTKGGNDCEYALRFAGDDKWLTIYDLSGGLNIKNLKLSATTVDDGTTDGRPALAIGDTADIAGQNPAVAVFDNYGASSWAFTADQGAVPGYRVPVDMGTNGTLDASGPKGLWDLRIQGTLKMTGGLKLFNCSGMNGC